MSRDENKLVEGETFSVTASDRHFCRSHFPSSPGQRNPFGPAVPGSSDSSLLPALACAPHHLHTESLIPTHILRGVEHLLSEIQRVSWLLLQKKNKYHKANVI